MKKLTEEFPPLGKMCLFYSEHFGYYVGMFDEGREQIDDNGVPLLWAVAPHTGTNVFEMNCLEYYDEHPTHWLPLPEAPEGE